MKIADKASQAAAPHAPPRLNAIIAAEEAAKPKRHQFIARPSRGRVVMDAGASK